jgi:hypothetical protein
MGLSDGVGRRSVIRRWLELEKTDDDSIRCVDAVLCMDREKAYSGTVPMV